MNRAKPNDKIDQLCMEKSVPSDGDGVNSVAVASIQQQTADILKLDIDCCEEAFDYLSLRSLLSLGQTCKQLNQVAGYIFRLNYAAADCDIYDYTANKFNVSIGRIGQPNCFIKFVYKINILYNGGLKQFCRIQSNFLRLKRINLMGIQLSDDTFENSKGILGKIEFLKLHNCKLQGNFHESVLAFCSNIKRLCVRQTNNFESHLIGNGNDWFHQVYPTLECFEIDTLNEEFSLAELISFLERNPNIRKLTIPDRFVKSSEASLIKSTVRLDDLIIWGASCDDEFYYKLNQLHEHGIYKRLTLYFRGVMPNQGFVDQIAPLNVIVKLRTATDGNSIKLSDLKSLEELCIDSSKLIADFHGLPKSLLNLERIEFLQASSDAIVPFIAQAVKLKRMKVKRLKSGIHFNADTNVIDLVTLNDQREKLIRAQKVTIYVQEDIYLSTKWAFEETNYSFIRLKREESNEWDHCFGNDM